MSEKLRAEWFWIDRWTFSSGFLLPMEARGVYREMLSQAWIRGGELPADFATLRRIINATEEEWNRCWPLVQAYWKQNAGKIYNETQREVLNASLTISEKRALAGRKGGFSKAANLGKPLASEAKPLANGLANDVAKGLAKTYPPSPSPSLSPNDNGKDAIASSSASADRETVLRIFAFWQKLFDTSRARLTDARSKKIRSRLRDCSLDEIEQALRGFASDSWWHDRPERHDLATLLRSREQVEKGLKKWDDHQNGRPKTSEPNKAQQRTMSNLDAIRRATEADHAGANSLQPGHGDDGGSLWGDAHGGKAPDLLAGPTR